MLGRLIERSNGRCYFIAAEFVDRSCQITPRLNWRCRHLDQNGLESFYSKRSKKWGALRASFDPPASEG
jgi:hypothetical protein